MILSLQVEKLSTHLNTLSPLIDEYQRGEPSFADDALKWLEEAEKTMSTLRLPEGSEMSALRGRIIRSADVSACSEGRGTRAALRRARNGAAADALERAEAVLRGRLLIADERLRLFEEKLCEGMTALMLQAPLPEMNMPHTEWLNEIWILLRQQQSTRPLYLYMSASLSPIDRHVILDRVSSRIIDEGLAHSPPSK